MLRLATVGTSAICEKFLAACRLTNRFEFYTAFSRDENRAESFACRNGFSKHSTFLENMAADDDLDAVYIASPNALHYSQSKLFLENGKHVICEKPIVTKSREYEELATLAERNGLIYMEAIMSQFSKGHDILHKAIADIGKISVARIDFCQRSSRYDAFLAGTQTNIFDMSLAAGTLMDLGIYCVWAAIDLFGMPEKIEASANYLSNGADAAGTAVFSYRDFPAVLTYSKTGQSAVGSEIIGSDGTVKIGSVSQYADISLLKNGQEELLLGMPERTEVMSGEAMQFADYIENRSFSTELYNDTLNVHKCMDLIKSSAGIKYPIKERYE